MPDLNALLNLFLFPIYTKLSRVGVPADFWSFWAKTLNGELEYVIKAHFWPAIILSKLWNWFGPKIILPEFWNDHILWVFLKLKSFRLLLDFWCSDFKKHSIMLCLFAKEKSTWIGCICQIEGRKYFCTKALINNGDFLCRLLKPLTKG